MIRIEKLKRLKIAVLCFCVFFISQTQLVFANGTPGLGIQIDDSGKWSLTEAPSTIGSQAGFMQSMIDKYKVILLFIFAISLLTSIAYFIINWVKLGASGTNEQNRRQAITGLLLSCIAFCGLGGIMTYVSLAYNLFK